MKLQSEIMVKSNIYGCWTFVLCKLTRKKMCQQLQTVKQSFKAELLKYIYGTRVHGSKAKI